MDEFKYTYFAPSDDERQEIESIRRQYSGGGREESKLERLRALDRRVKSGAIIWGLILGIAGCLTFGLGMAMVLEWELLLWGILIGAVGAIPMAIAYPVYRAVLSHNKSKYGPEIIRLSDELLQEERS